MEPVRLSVLGAASLQHGMAICAGLASFFGDRPLEIRFWDSDSERLDLFDRFARYLFALNNTPHRLISTEDPTEALSQSDRVLFAVDDHGAKRFLGENGTPKGVLSRLRVLLPEGAALLDLTIEHPQAPLDEEAERALPHTIMRYLRGDEYAYELLREHAASPIKGWLQNG